MKAKCNKYNMKHERKEMKEIAKAKGGLKKVDKEVNVLDKMHDKFKKKRK